MPYPIMTACSILRNRLPDKSPFVSYEFTPWYSGVPRADEDWGGVLVETFAASCDPPEEDPDGDGAISVKVQWVMPLAQAVGISSQFLAMTVNANSARLWDAL